MYGGMHCNVCQHGGGGERIEGGGGEGRRVLAIKSRILWYTVLNEHAYTLTMLVSLIQSQPV